MGSVLVVLVIFVSVWPGAGLWVSVGWPLAYSFLDGLLPLSCSSRLENCKCGIAFLNSLYEFFVLLDIYN